MLRSVQSPGFHVCMFGLLVANLLLTARVAADEEPPRWAARWGTRGSEPGQFERPRGLTLDKSDRLVICDTDNNRLQIFDTSGNLLDIWGETGSGPGQFRAPIGIDVAPNGEIYVVDTGNNRVQRFQPDGTWMGEWSDPGPPAVETWSPFALTVDRHHNVYVTDQGRMIRKFDSAGVFLRSWVVGLPHDPEGIPVGIDASPHDFVYVTRSIPDSLYQYTLDGVLVRRWGGFLTRPIPGTFKTPLGVEVDSLGNVFVIDHHNWRIQKFTGSGEFLSLWGIRGDQPDQFNDLHDITVGAGNNLFILQFDVNGYVTQWTYDPTRVEPTSMSRFKSLMHGDPGR